MAYVDEDVQGAIPDDTPRPPISGPDDQPPAAQPAATEQHEGLPEIGAPPYRQLGSKIASDIGEGVENLKQSGPVRLGSAVLGQATAPNPEDSNPGILAYLLGGTAGGGADPETAKKFAIPDKHKGASDDDANLLGVQKAFELGGPEAAWAMVQFNRGAYNANSAIAKHVANILGGKNDHAAAEAATKASAHMLDGSAVHYTAANGGFLATIKMPGTSQTLQIPLGRQAFVQAVDPMGAGQYDKVIEQGGMPAHLQRAAKFNGQAQSDGQGRFSPPVGRAAVKGEMGYSEAAHRGTDIVQSMDAPINAAGKGQAGHYPGSGNQPALKGQFDENGHWLGPKDKTKSPYNDDLEARSTGVFGRGNVNNEPARQEWMSKHKDVTQDQEAKFDQAEAGWKSREAIAKTRLEGDKYKADQNLEGRKYYAGSRERVEAVKAMDRALDRAARTNDHRLHEAASTARTKLLNPAITLTKEDEDRIDAIGKAGDPRNAQQSLPQAAQAPQAKTPQAGDVGKGPDRAGLEAEMRRRGLLK